MTLKSLFRKPSALALAVREMDEAMRELLDAQSASEYAQQMVVYHQRRIDRLQVYIKEWS